MENTFTALTSTNPTFGLVESGAFLQTGGNVQGDTISMTGTVDGANIAQISRTASSGAVSSYALNLAPTINVPNPTAGVRLTYTWLYNYNNTGVTAPITAANGSRFSDPGHGGEGEGGEGELRVES